MDVNILSSVTSNISSTYSTKTEPEKEIKESEAPETAKAEDKATKFSDTAAVYEITFCPVHTLLICGQYFLHI